MLWVVQNNLYNETGYQRFLDALDRLGMKYQVVKVVPFTNKLLHPEFDSMVDDFDTAEEPYIDPNQKIVVSGAISLCRIAKEKGWTPGSYVNENFDYEVWRDGFGRENMLNPDAVVGTVANIAIPNQWDWRFVRPAADTKALSGTVMSRYDFHDWRMSIVAISEDEYEHTPLHKDTKIIVAPQQEIYAEYRFFIVRGKVVTGSMYKLGSEVFSDNGDQVERDAEVFAGSMAHRWKPSVAYALDVARTPDGLKVIEINNINSSGFYGADVQKIIMAINDLEMYYAGME